MSGSPSLLDVESALHRLWIGEPNAALRKEDRKKARELVPFLEEIARRLPTSPKRSITIVDAAAGKSYLGFLTAEFLVPERENVNITTLERDPKRVELSLEARALLSTRANVECRVADVADVAAWPREATLAVALHACGFASDAVIRSAIASGAKSLLLAPCCTSKEALALPPAINLAERLGVPRAAPIRRRFLQSIVDAERTLRLEAAGYRVEVLDFVAPTVTPHNLLYRATLTNDEGRADRAIAELARLFPEGSEFRLE